MTVLPLPLDAAGWTGRGRGAESTERLACTLTKIVKGWGGEIRRVNEKERHTQRQKVGRVTKLKELEGENTHVRQSRRKKRDIVRWKEKTSDEKR